MAQDPYKYFRTEAREIVEQLGKDVLELETGRRAPDLIARLLRLAHTLKGAARVVKQVPIAEHAHAFEDALGPLRDERTRAPPDLAPMLLGILDAITERVDALSSVGASRPGAPEPAQAAKAPPEQLRTLRADIAEIDALLDGLGEVRVELASVRQCIGTVVRVREIVELLSVELTSTSTGNGAPELRDARAAAEGARALLTTLERDLVVKAEKADRELRQTRDVAERLRLVPAGLMFAALERALRDAAISLEKQVVFETKGADVRVDADVLAAVQSALVHVVRNAVAHGVEPAPARAAAGKGREGRVSLDVTRRGGRVAFTCTDDGRGVDVTAAVRAARRAGKLADGASPGTDEVLRLLLAGGISTSTSVTEVSGRGVGLDVVRETAARLGGDVAVRTEPDRGTTVEVIVPVSLSSMDALLVESAGEVAAIPLDSVRATLRLAPRDVTRSAEGESILWGGRVLPFAPLARSLGGRSGGATERAWSAVVIEGTGALAAVGVDRLVGTENVVLRLLGRHVLARPVIGGASLDAGGNPQPVLDPGALVAEVRAATRRAEPEAPRAPHPILVIDDSLTTRMLEQSILESAGYDVHVAASAEEGLAKATERRFALFLVDVEMPGMDGFTFVERTRADPALRSTPAILVTSRAAPEDLQRGRSAGASGYIIKSEFDQNDLLQRIRKLVGGA